MKWNGPIIDLIHRNLNLLINLDNVSPIVALPNEIWIMILDFISLSDFVSLKFLSKRFYRLSFLNKKLKYFNINSHKIFDVNEYYNTFLYFLDDLLKRFKMKFDFPTYLILKYSFEDLMNQSLISNCLFHLFSSPRSVFARNDCSNCSRIYIRKKVAQPKNFSCIDKFKFDMFYDTVDLSSDSLNMIKNFDFSGFFYSSDEYSVINSNRKRCLNTFIFQDYIQLVLVFFEIQLRIFVNFFYSLVNDNLLSDETFFLESCFTFLHRFIVQCIKKVKFVHFQKIFDEIDYNEFNSNYIKVINKKYVDYCNKKYAD